MKRSFYQSLLLATMLGSVLVTQVQADLLQKRVVAGIDDVEEHSDGHLSIGSSDLEMTMEADQQVIGIRFRDLGIPQGAVIDSAYIQFTVDETDDVPTHLLITVEDTSNAPIINGDYYEITSKTTLPNSVAWNPPAWNAVGMQGLAQRTSDLAMLVQIIVNKPTWQSGNAIRFIISGTGKRVADSFNGDATTAPLLQIQYHIETNPNVDTTPPEIRLLGENPLELALGDTFVDPGAEAIDNVDGNLTDAIERLSNVDTSVEGTYFVRYSVSDSTGNSSQVERIVKVYDPAQPMERVVYENAEDGKITRWKNLAHYPGAISNLITTDGNRIISLSGPTTTLKDRAAYTLQNEDGTTWHNSKDFIATWDMQTNDEYEIFFVAKSDDDPTITNYIGYVNYTPDTTDKSFDPATGYWSMNGQVMYSWGRYVYKQIDEDTTDKTTLVRDLWQDAYDALGINLTSVEYVHVNVYGDSTKRLVLDNIALQKEFTPPSNNAPVVRDLNLTLDENSTKSLTLLGSDEDNDTLRYEIVTPPGEGNYTLSGASFSYTAPLVEQNSTIMVTYKAIDSNGASSNEGVIKISVVDKPEPVQENRAPIANNVTVTLYENNTTIIELNATDPDGDALRYHYRIGDIAFDTDSPTITYKAPEVEEDETRIITYFVTDSEDLPSNEANITIRILNSVNHAPTVEDKTLTLYKNTSATITPTGSDMDNDALRYIVTSQPQHGRLDRNETTSTFTYTPFAGYVGSDSFTYIANDGELNATQAATVSLTIENIPPQTLDENKSIEVNCAGQMIDALSSAESNQTVVIHGSLSKGWDNDVYSFVSHNSAAKIKITLLDSDNQPLSYYVIRNCLKPFDPQPSGIYDLPENCGLVSIVVAGCPDEEKEYSLKIEYIVE